MLLDDGGCDRTSRSCAEGGGVLFGQDVDDIVPFVGGDIWFAVGGRQVACSATAVINTAQFSDIIKAEFLD